MKKRDFLKLTSLLGITVTLPLNPLYSLFKENNKLRVAQIGTGFMGISDMKSMSSHSAVEVIAVCDPDSKSLDKALEIEPSAKAYADYRLLFKELKGQIDAVIVSTPDHLHASISLLAMKNGINVYCQKPLVHYVSEAREMQEVAKKNKLITQMGIQVHSFYDYKLAGILIQKGIIGKVKKVIAWSNKNWGYDGQKPVGEDPVPSYFNWNLWQGNAPERPYKEGLYHPNEWRRYLDYGCATLGDMGVHIFDTPYNALKLDIPLTIKNDCRKPNDYGYPEENRVEYTFPKTKYTIKKGFSWLWYDGVNAVSKVDEDFTLPNDDIKPDQGAVFIGEKGMLLLPHFMQFPKLIIDDKYEDIDLSKYDPKGQAGSPTKDYEEESKKHYHQFVDACLGNAKCSAPFSYSGRLTEVILLGVVAGRFPGEILHWDKKEAKFKEEKANKYLKGVYRKF